MRHVPVPPLYHFPDCGMVPAGAMLRGYPISVQLGSDGTTAQAGPHRFRYTLYDGLQIKHLNELIVLLCYGGVLVGTIAAGYIVWQLP